MKGLLFYRVSRTQRLDGTWSQGIAVSLGSAFAHDAEHAPD